MSQKIIITSKLIAPCGMNCALCYAHQRDKKKCQGCNTMENNKPNYCRKCIIRNCDKLKSSFSRFCGKCDDYPCKRLKNLDKRYRSKYGMSMLENLAKINEEGIRRFVREEKERWKCKKCGKVLCVHREECDYCGVKRKKMQL